MYKWKQTTCFVTEDKSQALYAPNGLQEVIISKQQCLIKALAYSQCYFCANDHMLLCFRSNCLVLIEVISIEERWIQKPHLFLFVIHCLYECVYIRKQWKKHDPCQFCSFLLSLIICFSPAGSCLALGHIMEHCLFPLWHKLCCCRN